MAVLPASTSFVGEPLSRRERRALLDTTDVVIHCSRTIPSRLSPLADKANHDVAMRSKRGPMMQSQTELCTQDQFTVMTLTTLLAVQVLRHKALRKCFVTRFWLVVHERSHHNACPMTCRTCVFMTSTVSSEPRARIDKHHS